MRVILGTLGAVVGLSLLAAVGRAEKNADLKPTLVTADAVVKENFDAASLPEGWKVNKGEWQVTGGAVVGKELPADMHAAVLTLGKPFKSAAVRFSFKRDGAATFNLSFNHPKGHLFRIAVSDDALTLNKDKDKSDPASKIEVLGKAAGKFPAGQWHTLLVEVQGSKVTVQADNGEKILAQVPAFDVEKTGYRFVTRGSSLLIDDLTIWQGK